MGLKLPGPAGPENSRLISGPGSGRRIILRLEFIYAFLEAFRTHTVSGPRVEFGTEIRLHVQPFPVATHLATPTADPQEFFQVVQAFQQPLGDAMYPGPDQQDHQSPKRGPMPVGGKRFAKNEIGMRITSVSQESRISNEKPKASTQRMEFQLSFVLFIDLALFTIGFLSRKSHPLGLDTPRPQRKAHDGAKNLLCRTVVLPECLGETA